MSSALCELRMSPCYADERTHEPRITSDWQTPKSRILWGDPILVLWQRPSPQPPPDITCCTEMWGGSPLILLGSWRIEPGAPRTSFMDPTVPLRSSEMWGENLNCLYRILSSRISEACQNPSQMSLLLWCHLDSPPHLIWVIESNNLEFFCLWSSLNPNLV